jgi:hypothetical protein
MSGADFEDFINVDDFLATYEETNDESIIENIRNSLPINEDSDTEIDEEVVELSEDDLNTNDEPIKLYEALNSISLLRKFISQSQNLDSGHEILNKIENIILNNRFTNPKQTKITDFFKL